MPVDTNFSFNHMNVGVSALKAVTNAETLGKTAAEVGALLHESHPLPILDLLGPLRDFVGTADKGNAQRSWKGTGFNLIWRPNNGKQSGPADFFLELNMTQETLSFTDITGKTGVANRGRLQNDIFLGGMAYTQAIDDRFDGSGQHFETGVWINVPPTANPSEPSTVTRMGSIPHGTTVNLQGRTFNVPKPQFAPSSIKPFIIGSPDDGKSGLASSPDIDKALKLDPTSASLTPLSRVKGLTLEQFLNPNLFLQQAVAHQTIVDTTVIEISSVANKGTVPDVGGGVDNIAFLVGKEGGPNSEVPTVTAVFWIEHVKDAAGKTTLQLQYTQRVILNFNGLSWPHVTVATLTPQV